ncbi:MAG: hypothetical protein KBD83_03570 [Gammaproteobacteria bacterium]|nr:hypothetical protein [Gammaproteobacteria bacterium]
MGLNELQKGDVLSVALKDESFLAMFVGNILPRSSSEYMVVRVTSGGLVSYNLETVSENITNVFRYCDPSVAENAACRMAGWCMQRIPYDEQRHSSVCDQTAEVAKSNFVTVGFFNVVKFAARDLFNHALTQQTADSKGKGLRMTHFILLAFQIHFFEDKLVEQDSRFSFKAVGRDSDAIKALLKSHELNNEDLPESLKVDGKYLSAEGLLSHLSCCSHEWRMIPLVPAEASSFSLI